MLKFWNEDSDVSCYPHFVLGTYSVGQLGEMNRRNQGFHRQEEQNTATQATFHNQVLEFLPEAERSILWSVARFHPQKENPTPGGLFQSSSSCCLWNPGLLRKYFTWKGQPLPDLQCSRLWQNRHSSPRPRRENGVNKLIIKDMEKLMLQHWKIPITNATHTGYTGSFKKKTSLFKPL